MCLYVTAKNGRKPRLRVDRKDMTVYKVINNNNVSYHTGFQYLPNTEYDHGKPLEILPESGIVATYGVSEGFHSYYTYKSGLITFDMMTWAACDVKLVAFIIPKGAKFLRGVYDEVVSDKIRSGTLERLI